MSSLLIVLMVTLCVAPEHINGKQNDDQSMSPSSCCTCQPGTHGKPGPPRLPGRDGRDGRDGNQGITGLQGPKGEPGFQDPSGQKEKNGAGGFPGTPGLMSFKNWKECAWSNLDDAKDHGLIKDCVFIKNFSDTSLHVYWTGVLRVASCIDCCKRWYFTFNGAECAAPLPIDGIVYLGGAAQNPHRVRHIEGHCNNIQKGEVRVGFWVGNCRIYGNADANTGFNSVSRIFVEEVPKPQA